MKASEVYREAAKFCFDNDSFSCCAITHKPDPEGLYRWALRKEYEALFKPEGGFYAWGDMWGDESRKCRILALCFMAAIAESEGD